MTLAPIARIVARYFAGALVALGLLDQGAGDTIATDPEILMIIGAVLGVVTEGFYAMARKAGWST